MAIKVSGVTVVSNSRNIENVGDITATGNVGVTGNITTADITATGNVGVTGNMTATGNVTTADITATGNVSAADITATGNITFSGTGAIKIPSGTTLEQPASPVAGQLRYNTETNKPEIYNGTKFDLIAGAGGITTYTITDSPDSISEHYPVNGIFNHTEVEPSTLTILDTWEIPLGSDIYVSYLPTFFENYEHFEADTTISNDHLFFEKMTMRHDTVITVQSGKTIHGFG
jgi:hypothetical protein